MRNAKVHFKKATSSEETTVSRDGSKSFTTQFGKYPVSKLRKFEA